MKNLIRMSMPVLVMLGWQTCTVSPPTGDSGQFTPTDAEVEQYNARVAPEDRILCRHEKPVGTYIAKRVCRLQVDVDATSSLHRQQLRRVLN